jgi:hypothetical protein
MVVAADGQPKATFQAPPLKHDAAVGSGHALAKAVHTHAPAYLGLISTFCCHSLTSKIIIKTPNSGCTAGVFDSPDLPIGWGRVAIITHAKGFGQTSLLLC